MPGQLLEIVTLIKGLGRVVDTIKDDGDERESLAGFVTVA